MKLVKVLMVLLSWGMIISGLVLILITYANGLGGIKITVMNTNGACIGGAGVLLGLTLLDYANRKK